MLNTALYAGGGGILSAMVSALTGYGFAKYRFRGKGFLFTMILVGMLVPAVVLAVPQYLLVAKLGLANTYWAVLIPSIISPYGIYLARIYAGASVPDEVIEAARMDGSAEWRTFLRIGVPMMTPGLVTIFLFQFVAIWNNFLLPWLMLSSENKYPLTVGLFTLLDAGTSQPSLYSLVLVGSLLSILPLIALFFLLQRFWRVDLDRGIGKVSGAPASGRAGGGTRRTTTQSRMGSGSGRGQRAKAPDDRGRRGGGGGLPGHGLAGAQRRA